MKKKIVIMGIALLLTIVLLSVFVFAGCDFTRKLTGAELSFPSKVKGADKLSFKMNVTYTKEEVTTVIDMDCYRAKNEAGEEEYAYVYSTEKAANASYKNIYADGKLYEQVNVTKVSGFYHVTDNVSVEDDENILYHITKKIFLTSVAAFVSKAKTETLRGEEVYRYDVSISDKNISLWYNKNVLVQIYVAFESDGEPTEEYTIYLSDYTFDQDLPEDTFKRPDTYGINYLESPITFESWTGILTSFGSKLG